MTQSCKGGPTCLGKRNNIPWRIFCWTSQFPGSKALEVGSVFGPGGRVQFLSSANQPPAVSAHCCSFAQELSVKGEGTRSEAQGTIYGLWPLESSLILFTHSLQVCTI